MQNPRGPLFATTAADKSAAAIDVIVDGDMQFLRCMADAHDAKSEKETTVCHVDKAVVAISTIVGGDYKFMKACGPYGVMRGRNATIQAVRPEIGTKHS